MIWPTDHGLLVSALGYWWHRKDCSVSRVLKYLSRREDLRVSLQGKSGWVSSQCSLLSWPISVWGVVVRASTHPDPQCPHLLPPPVSKLVPVLSPSLLLALLSSSIFFHLIFFLKFVYMCVHVYRGQPWVVSSLLSSCLRQGLLFTTAQVRLAHLWTGDSPMLSSHFPDGICLSMGPEALLCSSHLYDKHFIH